MKKALKKLSTKNPVTTDALRILMHYKVFKEKHRFLRESQWWNKEQLEQYQLQQLKNLLDHVYENVPYYKKLFDRLGLKPSDIRSFKDLEKLPFLTKEIVRKNVEDFKARNFDKKKFEYITTGGSTGLPLGIYVERGAAEARHMAYLQTIFDEADCSFFNKHVYLIGSDTVCKYQIFGRIMILSSFSMDDENLPFHVNRIKRLKPKFIVGYPSAITNLARFIKKKKIQFFSDVNAIIFSGETLFDWQRDLAEEVFQCKTHAFYNHVEQLVFAGTCNRSRYYHVYPQYGIVELIDKNGKPVTNEGAVGEIVATGFNSYIFPLIRYKTGDMAVFTTEKCGCGRNYTMFKNIEGRVQEFIVSKTKRVIPLTGVYGLVAKCSQNVKDCQFYQDTEGKIILNIVKDENYSNSDEVTIKDSFQKKFREEIDLMIQYVNDIPRTTGGKSKFLIQKLTVTP
jgi:phenylacetate-CoA ligase